MSDQSLEASEWIGHGTGILTRRSALPDSHPESWPSLWLLKYKTLEGFPWENIGINAPTCPHCKEPYEGIQL